MKTPKIAQALADLVGIARKETSPDRIKAALADARGQIEAAKADRTAAETAYRDGLLDAPEAELQKRLAERDAATVRLDRAEALTAALTERLALASEAETRAARQSIHDDAVAKCEAIRARLPVEYGHHALAIRHLLRDLAEAECARERAAKEAPDFPDIPSPEVEIRSLHGVPEETVSVETVELWVIDGRTDPVPEDRQGNVRRYDERRDRGTLTIPGNTHPSAPTSGVALTCTLRAFTRTRYRDGVVAHDDGSLLRSVSLPYITGNGPCFVTASPYRDHNGALIELATDLPATALLVRPIREKLELAAAIPRLEEATMPAEGPQTVSKSIVTTMRGAA